MSHFDVTLVGTGQHIYIDPDSPFAFEGIQITSSRMLVTSGMHGNPCPVSSSSSHTEPKRQHHWSHGFASPSKDVERKNLNRPISADISSKNKTSPVEPVNKAQRVQSEQAADPLQSTSAGAASARQEPQAKDGKNSDTLMAFTTTILQPQPESRRCHFVPLDIKSQSCQELASEVTSSPWHYRGGQEDILFISPATYPLRWPLSSESEPRAGIFEPMSSHKRDFDENDADDDEGWRTGQPEHLKATAHTREGSFFSDGSCRLLLRVGFPTSTTAFQPRFSSSFICKKLMFAFQLRRKQEATASRTSSPTSNIQSFRRTSPAQRSRVFGIRAQDTDPCPPFDLIFLFCKSPEQLSAALDDLHAAACDDRILNFCAKSAQSCVPIKCHSSDVQFTWNWEASDVISETSHECLFAFVTVSLYGQHPPVVLMAYSLWIAVDSTEEEQSRQFIDQVQHLEKSSLSREQGTPSSKSLPATWDSTELSLADVREDSPLLRAANANLERKTTNIKKANKAILKAASEVKTQLVALQASQSALDEALASLTGVCPGLEECAADTFLQQRSHEARMREDELRIIDEFIEAPIKASLERCRAAQDAQRRFDAESKSYYAGTQKWLALASGHNEIAANLREKSSMGSEKMSGRTAKSAQSPHTDEQRQEDGRQKSREAKYALARLQLFEVLSSLHGGATEADVATHLLAACAKGLELRQSLWSTESLTGIASQLSHHERTLQGERQRQAEDQATLIRRINELESLLSPEANSISVHPNAEGDSSRLSASLPANLRAGSAAKLRGILQSVAGSSAIADITNSTESTSPSFKGLRQHVQARLMPGNGTPSRMTALTRWRHSSSAEANPAPGTHSPPAISTAYVDDVGFHAKTKSTVFTMQDSHIFKPSPRRSVSMIGPKGAKAEPVPHHDSTKSGGPSANSPARASLDGAWLSFGKVNISSPRVTDLMPPPLVPASDTSTRVTDTSSRKKEGILWILSKSLPGSVGADAPKSASRSQYWHEAWVVLSGSGHLGEYADWKEKDSRSTALTPSGPIIDLRLATVREARGVERRWAFEVVTRKTRRLYQASSETSMREWMSAINRAIESLINGTSSVRQVDKVAKHESISPIMNGGILTNDWGARTESSRSTVLGQHRPWSQSLTDLSGISGVGGKLFQKQPAHGIGSPNFRETKKRHSRTEKHTSLGGHLVALSEGNSGPSSSPSGFFWSATDSRSTRRASGSEGISNKTPVSGYVGAPPRASQSMLDGNQQSSLLRPDHNHSRNYSAASAATILNSSASAEGMNGSSAAERDLQLDKRIEAMVEHHYGGSSSGNEGGSNLSSSRMAIEFPRMYSEHHSSEKGKPTESRRRPSNFRPDQTSLHHNPSDKYRRSALVSRISNLPANSTCFDCGTDDPRWASWSLHNQLCCIFICIRCSGMHRALGVHISKVKSVDLDDWSDEQAEAARAWGNDRARTIWEALKPEGMQVMPDFVGGELEGGEFWQRKYVRQEWRTEPGAPLVADAVRDDGRVAGMSEMTSREAPAGDIDADAGQDQSDTKRIESLQARGDTRGERMRRFAQSSDSSGSGDALAAAVGPAVFTASSACAQDSNRSSPISRTDGREVSVPPRESLSLEPGGLIVDELEVKGLPSPLTLSSQDDTSPLTSPTFVKMSFD